MSSPLFMFVPKADDENTMLKVLINFIAMIRQGSVLHFILVTFFVYLCL